MADTATAQERLFALREQIARMEGSAVPALAAATRAALAKEPVLSPASKRLPLGIPFVDDLLEGGIPLVGITEIRSRLFRDAGAAGGFALALAALLQHQDAGPSAVLWIGDRAVEREMGQPCPAGLVQFGLKMDAFLHAVPAKLADALWLAETAVASGALCVTILEIGGNPLHFGLTESRRLSLRAKAAGRPLLLLRHAGEEEAGSAALRFLAEPGPASERRLPDGSMLGGSIGSPVFRLILEKSRNPAPVSFLLEWNAHDRQFSLAGKPPQPVVSGDEAAHSGSRLSAPAHRPDRTPVLGSVLAFERAS